MIETVFYKADRVTYPWYKKINPVWWFGNDEAKPTDTFVYLYLRNFMMNFKRFVVGVGDRDHWVTGKVPALTVLRSDLQPKQLGVQWSFIHVFGIPLLPFFSYSSPAWEFYVGWQPWGELAFKFTRADGKGWQLW